MLDKRIPETWKTFCEGNNLALEIQSEMDKSETPVAKQRDFLYRELANNLIFIAKNSPEDSLKNVMIIRLKLISQKIDINAVTEGKYLVKFRHLTRTNFIAAHLKSTVQVQEVQK